MVDTPQVLATVLASLPVGVNNGTGVQAVRNIAVSAYNIVPVIVSAAGTTQGTATALVSHSVVVTSVAPGTGVVATLPYHKVLNRGANPLTFYPISGANFESLAANAGFLIAAGSWVEMFMGPGTQGYLVYTGAL